MSKICRATASMENDMSHKISDL